MESAERNDLIGRIREVLAAMPDQQVKDGGSVQWGPDGNKARAVHLAARFGHRFDPQPFHIDPVAAKNSMFGRLVAPGALVICARSWLSNQLDKIPAYSAGLGVEHMNLILPVLAGDVLKRQRPAVG